MAIIADHVVNERSFVRNKNMERKENVYERQLFADEKCKTMFAYRARRPSDN